MASSSSSSMNTAPPENLLIEGVHCLYDPCLNGIKKPDFDVVFIPGLKAGAAKDHWWKTWTARGKEGEPDECWPYKWLPEKFPGARVLAFTFGPPAPNQTPLALWQSSINCVNAMRTTFVRLGERPYFLVGHSVGGLLLKEILLTADTRAFDQTMVENCKGIGFYGVPHLGTNAHLETLFGVSFSFREFQHEVKLLGDNCFKRNTDFNPLASSIPSYNFAENYQTEIDGNLVHVVPHAVAGFNTNASKIAFINADHFDVCRPTARTDMNFLCLVGFIEEKLNEASIPYREEVPILT